MLSIADHHQRLRENSKDPFAKATTSNRAPRLSEVKHSVRVLLLMIYILFWTSLICLAERCKEPHSYHPAVGDAPKCVHNDLHRSSLC